MKNSTAQSNRSQGEKENGRKNSHVSESSVFWFPVYEGIFEHAAIMQDAVWLFMWLIARTTVEGDGKGEVLGGIPITDDRPAAELGIPVKTVRRWRQALVCAGYVNTVRTPYGFRYTLLKSKKWQKRPLRDLPKREIPKSDSTQNEHSDFPPRAVRVPESDRESARSGKYKEDNIEKTQGRLNGTHSANRPPNDLEGGGNPLPRPTPEENIARIVYSCRFHVERLIPEDIREKLVAEGRDVRFPPDPGTLRRSLSSVEEFIRLCQRDRKEPAKWITAVKTELEKQIATTHWVSSSPSDGSRTPEPGR